MVGICSREILAFNIKKFGVFHNTLLTLCSHNNVQPNNFQNAVIPSVADYRLLEYTFNDLNLDDDGTVKASIRMFMELDLLDKFRVDYEVK